MRQNTATRRTRYLQLGMPAAVIGALAGTMVAVPAEAASASSIVERQRSAVRLVPSQVAPAAYVVQPGDTVSAIAANFGLRTVDVLTWNGLSWRSVIYPGQTLTLAPAAVVAAPVAVAPTATVHTVVAGDTVYGIAQKYGTTVDAVLTVNGLTRASIIYPGQTLAVSGSAAAPAPAPVAAPVTVVAPVAVTAHTVVAGDTIFGIARKYGTTTQALFALNGLDSSSVIYPGQTISVQGAPAPAPAAAPAATATALTAEQAANAALIIRVGRELGVSDRAVAIALATGMVESGLRNLDWGDRDSLGIFQQRPSTGWGAPAQIMDADRSTRVFYGGPSDPNGQMTRGLLDIPGWESMAFTDAAQAVQISAYPDKYGQWEAQAYSWLALYG
ncbi:LysM peptidoglycan-binding domain-containing protein [Microbacterium sp. EST19A]|uniref:LysM peptidoglycan-binding domain-containing protein n=1 Tax=Microbacterium sp. EST19A TaxID=2862681 RepID=UPI001CBEB4ED|nr:LysM peptidoglycan-binding domain-containing protein [Microbacterium sp. EST19A]